MSSKVFRRRTFFKVSITGGSRVPEEYLPDVVYNTFLKSEASGWKVILDLTRTDVPSDREVMEIRRRFPSDIPRQIVPQFWKDLLKL